MSEVNGTRGSGLGAGGSGLGAGGSGLGAGGSELGARHSDETLADYERELQAALSIEPSASFEARVRQRVENDAAHRRFGWTPAVGWLAAAAALVIVAGVVSRLPTTSDDSVEAPRMAQQRPDVVLPSLAPPAPGGPASEEAGRRVTPRRSGVTPRRPAREPEVIVVNQMDAVRRLVDAVADGRLAVPEPPQGPAGPPAEMAIAPLVVEPMPGPTVDPAPVPPLPDTRKIPSRSTL